MQILAAVALTVVLYVLWYVLRLLTTVRPEPSPMEPVPPRERARLDYGALSVFALLLALLALYILSWLAFQ